MGRKRYDRSGCFRLLQAARGHWQPVANDGFGLATELQRLDS